MTTLRKEIRKCIHCGCETEFVLVTSTNSFGACDLDSRPAPMARETIAYGIQRCPKCNYANTNISVETLFNPEILESEIFLKVLNSDYPELAKSYMLGSIISESIEEYDEAAYDMLNASWVLDDNNIDARKTRKVAAKLFEKIHPNAEKYIILIDLYRRAEDFDMAKKWLATAKQYTTDKYLKKLLFLEEQLIDTYDSECHNCDDYNNYKELGFDDELKIDSFEEIERKLFDENSDETIILNFRGEPTEFSQIGVFHANIDGKERLFAMLSCPEIDEETGFVFEIIGMKKIEDFVFVNDDYTNEKVFEVYYKLLEENNKLLK